MTQHHLHQPSQGTRYSLYYITAGSLTLIWSGVWYYYLRTTAVPSGDSRYFVCTGLLLTGLAFLIIGTLIGRIGREATSADVPVGTLANAPVVPGQPVPQNGNNGVEQPQGQVAAPVAAAPPQGQVAAPVATVAPQRQPGQG